MITSARATALVDAILSRRTRADDPNLASASDDPLELISYLLDHLDDRRVSEAIRQADVIDALHLLAHVHQHVPAVQASLERMEYELLQHGIRLGLSLRELGVPLGLRTRQSTLSRVQRLAQARVGERRDPAAYRERQSTAARRRDWARRRGRVLMAAMPALQARLDRLDEAVRSELEGEVDELIEAINSVPLSPVAAEYPHKLGVLAAWLRLLSPQLPAGLLPDHVATMVVEHQRLANK